MKYAPQHQFSAKAERSGQVVQKATLNDKGTTANNIARLKKESNIAQTNNSFIQNWSFPKGIAG